MMPCRRAIRCAIRIDDMSSEPSRTASTTLTAATTSAASSAQPKPSTRRMPSVRASVASRMPASADQHEQEAEDERDRQPQRGEHGRDDRVQRRHDRRDEQRAPEAVDPDSGQDPGGHHERDAGGDPRRRRAGTAAGADAPAATRWARVRWTSRLLLVGSWLLRPAPPARTAGRPYDRPPRIASPALDETRRGRSGRVPIVTLRGVCAGARGSAPAASPSAIVPGR